MAHLGPQRGRRCRRGFCRLRLDPAGCTGLAGLRGHTGHCLPCPLLVHTASRPAGTRTQGESSKEGRPEGAPGEARPLSRGSGRDTGHGTQREAKGEEHPTCLPTKLTLGRGHPGAVHHSPGERVTNKHTSQSTKAHEDSCWLPRPRVQKPPDPLLVHGTGPISVWAQKGHCCGPRPSPPLPCRPWPPS